MLAGSAHISSFYKHTLTHQRFCGHKISWSATFCKAASSKTLAINRACNWQSSQTYILAPLHRCCSTIVHSAVSRRRQSPSTSRCAAKTACSARSTLALHSRQALPVPMARQAADSLHSSAACRAYVGEAAPPAGEYHCNDFEWEDLRREAEALLRTRSAQLQNGASSAAESQSALEPHDPRFSLKANSSLGQQPRQQNQDSSEWQYKKGCWEAFHARDNATARFYKERRYLLLEFPCLTISEPPQHFMEIGCGCGSSLLPVLKANPSCTVTGTDLSPTAVGMFKLAAVKAGIADHRFDGYAADSTQSDAVPTDKALIQSSADAVLLIFTLAAVAPAEMPAMLKTAYQALRPGGSLLIRDHGLYDLTHLRLPFEQQLADKLYRRLDGTTCYFFTIEDLQAKAEAAGFVTVECKYACTHLLNRKKQIDMKRVFVHGVFEKPCASDGQGAT